MNNDTVTIPDLYKAFQEICRLGQENEQLRFDLRDAELRHMHAEFAYNLEKEMHQELRKIHFGSSVQKEAP